MDYKLDTSLLSDPSRLIKFIHDNQIHEVLIEFSEGYTCCLSNSMDGFLATIESYDADTLFRTVKSFNPITEIEFTDNDISIRCYIRG